MTDIEENMQTEDTSHAAASVKEEMSYLKYLITLSTGSILIQATLLEKIFKTPIWKWLMVGSFASFMLSIITALIAYLALIQAFQDRKTSDEWDHARWVSIPALITMIAFVTGLLCFTIFSIRNFLNI